MAPPPIAAVIKAEPLLVLAPRLRRDMAKIKENTPDCEVDQNCPVQMGEKLKGR